MIPLQDEETLSGYKKYTGYALPWAEFFRTYLEN